MLFQNFGKRKHSVRKICFVYIIVSLKQNNEQQKKQLFQDWLQFIFTSNACV